LTAPRLRPNDVTGHHVGLRAEALDYMASGGIPPKEEHLRYKREQAREWGDADAVAYWSRLLWRHYVRGRYTGRRPPSVVVPVEVAS
jgi:hypothetical protein